MAELNQRRGRHPALMLVVLVALLFRASVPVGFMPMTTVDGGLTMMFCPGSGQAIPIGSLSADPDAHHHNHPDAAQGMAGHVHGQKHTGHGSDGMAGDAGTCAFAASGTSAPAPIVHVEPAYAPIELHPVSIPVMAVGTVPTISRSQSPRAPPRLA